MEKKKRKRRKIDGRKKIILALDGALLVALVAAAIVLAITLSGRKGKTSVQTGADVAQTAAAAQASPTADDNAQNGSAAQSGAEAISASAAVTGDAADKLQVDFAALANEGVPAIAYLASEGTTIRYPVVQSMDNEYYMTRGADGKKDKNGAIFLDCRNSGEFLDAQIVIFGNPMADGSMFGSLISYRDEAYLREHPSLYLYTQSGNFRIDVFAAHTASPEMSNYPIWFTDEGARADYIQAAQVQSPIKPNVTIEPNAQLICLVTSSDFDSGANTRYVVHGVLTKL